MCSNLDNSRPRLIGVGSGNPDGDRDPAVAIVGFFEISYKIIPRLGLQTARNKCSWGLQYHLEDCGPRG